MKPSARLLRPISALVSLVSLLSLPSLPFGSAWAQDAEPTPRAAIRGQLTWIWQAKPAFQAAYSGPNSIIPQEERAYSFTSSLDLGVRLWRGAQLHLNPEATAGVPLSNLSGAGGLSNGELARTSGPNLNGYRARLFLLQRWNAGGATETLDADFNELGGSASEQRWTLAVGNFSLLDFFDNNPYAKDPRSQFFNWAHMTYGAWDYAADSRGYTHGAMLEYRRPAWTVRLARAAQPTESNGLTLDPALGQRFGDQLELETDLPLRTAAGPVRASLLAWRNQAVMAAFRDATRDAAARGATPELARVRREQTKTGWGLTLLLPLADDAGVFLRSSANDGATETYAFTEIDRQTALGAQLTGQRWGRGADRLGFALAINELSEPHRDFLAAGGLGFFLGDGRLNNYASEQVLEAWYRWELPPLGSRVGKLQSALSLGWQQISNPGYNADRGPVQVYSLRWHSEF